MRKNFLGCSHFLLENWSGLCENKGEEKRGMRGDRGPSGNVEICTIFIEEVRYAH